MAGRSAVWAGLRTVLDFVLPPRCVSCGIPAGSPGALCAGCWRQVEFLAAPHCSQCGSPFEMDLGPGVRCGACLTQPPYFDRARAAVAYGDRVAQAVIALKHGDRTDLAPGLARWMLRAGSELLEEADLILPVPLHPRRLFQRRFNQAVLLAGSLAKETGVPLVTDLLRRHRDTASQGRLSPRARRRNVEGAFRIAADCKARIRDCRIVLIDDVLTTGATANAIAQRLKRDGAAAVDVLTFARVVRPTAPA